MYIVKDKSHLMVYAEDVSHRSNQNKEIYERKGYIFI